MTSPSEHKWDFEVDISDIQKPQLDFESDESESFPQETFIEKPIPKQEEVLKPIPEKFDNEARNSKTAENTAVKAIEKSARNLNGYYYYNELISRGHINAQRVPYVLRSMKNGSGFMSLTSILLTALSLYVGCPFLKLVDYDNLRLIVLGGLALSLIVFMKFGRAFIGSFVIRFGLIFAVLFLAVFVIV